MARKLGMIPETGSAGEWNFLWVVDPPLFERNEEKKRWEAAHHVFTRPHDECIDLLDSDPGKALCYRYDLVLNGFEIAKVERPDHGGSRASSVSPEGAQRCNQIWTDPILRDAATSFDCVDLRFLWMRQKRVQGSHFANLLQARQANQLMIERRLDPCMSEVFPFADIPLAHEKMLDNKHLPGNMAVLVTSPKPGLRTVEDVLEAGPTA